MNRLTFIDFAALSPLLIVLGASLVLLLIESFAEKIAKVFTPYFTIASIVVALIAAVYAPESHSILLTPWLRFDSIGRLFNIFFLVIGLGSTLLAFSFFQHLTVTRGEYFFLLLSSLFGLMLIGSAADFLTLFLGLETLSISLYILCCYMKHWTISHEASIKYFLMGSLAAAFLLYGIALIYGAVGHTQFDHLAVAYKGLTMPSERTLFLSGVALVTVGFAFKAAVVPFHVWAPDVYDGAPTPVTGFMAVGTKVGAFAALALLFLVVLPQFDPLWNRGIAFLAYPTMIYANIVALRQIQLRRFFAYSGIAHAGYMLIPLAAGTPEALPALLFYLVVYALATMGAFAVITLLDERAEGVMMHDLSGLYRRSPLLAGVLALCLLTLTGLPPTAGFFAKFYIFKVGFQAGYYGLVIVGLLTAVLAAFYYLRIIAVMFSEAPRETLSPRPSWPATVVAVACAAAILLLSIFPESLVALTSLNR